MPFKNMHSKKTVNQMKFIGCFQRGKKHLLLLCFFFFFIFVPTDENKSEQTWFMSAISTENR